MLKREEVLGLVIGLFIVMIVVALTLPTEKVKEVNRQCYKECKLMVKQDKKRSIWSGSSYFSKLGDCMEACTEESRENRD